MMYVHFEKLVNIANNAKNLNDKIQLKSDIYQYRHQILSQFAINNDLLMPVYDQQMNGKPVVVNSHLVFNQSHDDDNYALVLSLDVHEIGVDIECVNRVVNAKRLAERFFHADEYALWQERGCGRELWFKIWTIKEAVLKANGLGIRLNLNELNAKFTNNNQGVVRHKKIGFYRFECIALDHHVMTIAYASDDWQAWQFY